MPYYWKRGLVLGVVVGLMLHILLQQLSLRTPPQPQGNLEVSQPTRKSQPVRHQTPLGLVMGLTLFVLCCAMPGPQEMTR